VILKDKSLNTKKCPECGTDRVRRARRENVLDRIFSLANFYPYYCAECSFHHRFYSFGRQLNNEFSVDKEISDDGKNSRTQSSRDRNSDNPRPADRF
jgi:hypothetical protein